MRKLQKLKDVAADNDLDKLMNMSQESNEEEWEEEAGVVSEESRLSMKDVESRMIP